MFVCSRIFRLFPEIVLRINNLTLSLCFSYDSHGKTQYNLITLYLSAYWKLWHRFLWAYQVLICTTGHGCAEFRYLLLAGINNILNGEISILKVILIVEKLENSWLRLLGSSKCWRIVGAVGREQEQQLWSLWRGMEQCWHEVRQNTHLIQRSVSSRGYKKTPRKNKNSNMWYFPSITVPIRVFK